jgi:hypothetical protein
VPLSVLYKSVNTTLIGPEDSKSFYLFFFYKISEKKKKKRSERGSGEVPLLDRSSSRANCKEVNCVKQMIHCFGDAPAGDTHAGKDLHSI